MRILILGCGYVGLPLGAELMRQGHEVFGVRRSLENTSLLKKTGINPLVADITNPTSLAALPSDFDWVVNTVAAGRGAQSEYRDTYLQGTRNVIDWLAATPPKKYVYTSSTSVYGQNDGSLVTESSPTEPMVDTSKILVETEQLLLTAVQQRKFPAVILRSAGIYGPGRGYYFLEFLMGNAKIPGRGDHFANMIHRDDLIGAIIAALKHGHPGQIYNAVDDEPVPVVRLYRWLAESLGSPMPPFVPETPETASKRGNTNKRISNRKLKMELGYRFKYPTFRDGFTAEIQRLDEGGNL